MARIGIKICGISDRINLDAAIAAGADHIGLVFFAKSPRNVGIEQAAALAEHAAGRAKLSGCLSIQRPIFSTACARRSGWT
jgi:phosphoribosylanthranilate isomerase